MTDLSTIPAVHLDTVAEWLRHRSLIIVSRKIGSCEDRELANQSETIFRLTEEVEAAMETKHEGE